MNANNGAASIRDVLTSLPALEDDLYLQMQATNLGVIDGYLRDLEADLLAEYMEEERTPLNTAVFVSALSQLWIFGIYELLRTWRQRLRELIAFADRIDEMRPQDRIIALEDERTRQQERSDVPEEFSGANFDRYDRVEDDPAYKERLVTAYDASELLFRRLEALRVFLAKHEVPKSGGAAFAPGYGRIDMTNGSIVWQVSLGNGEVDTVSRQAIANEIPTLLESIEHYVLPRDLQERVRPLEKIAYGLKQVIVVLGDGREIPGTMIAWNKIVTAVLGEDVIPFDAMEVVDVKPDPDAERWSGPDLPDDVDF